MTYLNNYWDLGNCKKTILPQNFPAHKSLCMSELVVGDTEVTEVFGKTSTKILTIVIFIFVHMNLARKFYKII